MKIIKSVCGDFNAFGSQDPSEVATAARPHGTLPEYNTIQYNTIQYNTIQYNTIQYNTIQYNTVQYNTIQYNTIQYNTIQYNTIQYNTIQYNTIQYNTIQYNTIQYNTIQVKHEYNYSGVNPVEFRGHIPSFQLIKMPTHEKAILSLFASKKHNQQQSKKCRVEISTSSQLLCQEKNNS